MQFTKSFVESATFIASETKYIFCGEKKEFKYLFKHKQQKAGAVHFYRNQPRFLRRPKVKKE